MYSKSTINGFSYYTCTKKKSNSTNKTCRTISENEYNSFKSRIRGNVLNKVRYNFIDDNERFRLDLFDINGELLTILERDVVDNNRKSLPKFIKESIDITNNRNYDDDSLYIDNIINEIYLKRKH